MRGYLKPINDHYGQANLEEKITGAIERSGKRLEDLTRDDIASFDEFHIRGREATRELAHLAGLREGLTVLDLGCGVGGPARTLAAEFGCVITGVDLVEDYCRTADMLTQRVGLADRVTFHQGDILNLPFDRDSFDVAWTQHTTMNIEDKVAFFNEIRRVLRPAGRLALYEICAGSVEPPHFPLPWAGDPTINFLVTATKLKQTLSEAGFNELEWTDVTSLSLDWFRAVVARMAKRPADAPPPLGLNLLMGETTPQKAANLVRNLEEDRTQVVQGVLSAKK